MAEAAGAVLYGLEKVVEGTVLAAKGIYDPTLPLKATLTPLTSINIPLAYHSVSIIKGRAYVFGGRLNNEGESVKVADSGVQVLILPTSGIESADYKKIEESKESPPKRYGHSSAVIEERIYIIGGYGEDGQLLNENGRVWVFDTSVNKWSHFDPSEKSEKPEPRAYGGAVASVHPRPARPKVDVDILPQDPPDPASKVMMPDIPATDTYGTLIIQGGTGKDDKHINDLWSFDISTRSWVELPSPPPPASSKPSLAMVGSRLYTFAAGQTSYLDLTQSSYNDEHGIGELGLSPIAPWQSLQPHSSSPEHPFPGERIGASLIPITTGQGRNYLALLGGDTEEDIWVQQLRPEGMTAASFTL